MRYTIPHIIPAITAMPAHTRNMAYREEPIKLKIAIVVAQKPISVACPRKRSDKPRMTASTIAEMVIVTFVLQNALQKDGWRSLSMRVIMENIFPYDEFFRMIYDPSCAVLSATKERIKRATADEMNIIEVPKPK